MSIRWVIFTSGQNLKLPFLCQYLIFLRIFFAFVKERFHNAVEIDILGIFEGYSLLQYLPPPQKIFRGEIIQGE